MSPSRCPLDSPSEMAGERAARRFVNAVETLAHRVFRRDKSRARLLQRFLPRRKRLVPETIGERAGDQALTAFAAEFGTGRDQPASQFTTPLTLVSTSGEAMSFQSRTLSARRRIGQIEGHDARFECCFPVVLKFHGKGRAPRQSPAKWARAVEKSERASNRCGKVHRSTSSGRVPPDPR